MFPTHVGNIYPTNVQDSWKANNCGKNDHKIC